MLCFPSWKLSTIEPLTRHLSRPLTLVEWGEESKLKLVGWNKNSLLIENKEIYNNNRENLKNNNNNNNGKEKNQTSDSQHSYLPPSNLWQTLFLNLDGPSFWVTPPVYTPGKMFYGCRLSLWPVGSLVPSMLSPTFLLCTCYLAEHETQKKKNKTKKVLYLR